MRRLQRNVSRDAGGGTGRGADPGNKRLRCIYAGVYAVILGCHPRELDDGDSPVSDAHNRKRRNFTSQEPSRLVASRGRAQKAPGRRFLADTFFRSRESCIRHASSDFPARIRSSVKSGRRRQRYAAPRESNAAALRSITDRGPRFFARS